MVQCVRGVNSYASIWSLVGDMHRVLCLGSRWSSLNSALPRKTIPYRWAHLFAINNKKHLFDKFNGFLGEPIFTNMHRMSMVYILGRSPRGVNEVHEFFRQCVLGLKLEHPDSRVAIANTMWNGLKKKGNNNYYFGHCFTTSLFIKVPRWMRRCTIASSECTLATTTTSLHLSSWMR